MRKNEEIRGKRLGQLKGAAVEISGKCNPKQGLNGAYPDG
jgi:hypothetical protein